VDRLEILCAYGSTSIRFNGVLKYQFVVVLFGYIVIRYPLIDSS